MNTQHPTPTAGCGSPSEGQAIAGIEAVELTDQDAEDTLVTDFGALALEPMEESEFSQRLCRAGFASPRSPRCTEREAQKVTS